MKLWRLNTYRSKFCLYFIFSIFFTACVQKQPYTHFLPITDFHWIDSTYEKCYTTRRADLEILISHPTLTEANSTKYEFCLDLGDTIYFGKYRNRIILKQIPICLDEGRSSVWLRMALLDSTEKKAYIWQNKETYQIANHNKISVQLRSSAKRDAIRNAFEISFGNGQ